MTGIEASIANLSMNMAQQNVQTQLSAKMLSNVLEASEQNAVSLVNQLSQSVAPAPGINETGGLMDITV